jgi:2-dehydro-3-deoxygalactonokinase
MSPSPASPRPDARSGATKDPRLRVSILPGLKQAVPPDVMRGEETQIAGFLAAAPGFDGVLCLPGTHAKWVQISAEEVVSFRTFMTGELFDLLSTQSVLRHSIAGEGRTPMPLRGRVETRCRGPRRWRSGCSRSGRGSCWTGPAARSDARACRAP